MKQWFKGGKKGKSPNRQYKTLNICSLIGQRTSNCYLWPHLAIKSVWVELCQFEALLKSVICLCSYVMRAGPRFVQINVALIVQKYRGRVFYYILISVRTGHETIIPLWGLIHRQDRHFLATEFTIHTRQKKKKIQLSLPIKGKKARGGRCQSLIRYGRSSYKEHEIWKE